MSIIHYAPKFLIEIHYQNKSKLYDIKVQVSTHHLVASINPNMMYISDNKANNFRKIFKILHCATFFANKQCPTYNKLHMLNCHFSNVRVNALILLTVHHPSLPN